MAGTSSGDRKNLVGWVRLDVNGNIIPGSEQYRPIGKMPKNGYWRQIQSDYTSCNGTGSSILTIINNSASNVTSVTSTDGTFKYTTTIASSGGMYTFVLPFGYDFTFNIVAAGSVTAAVTTVVANGSGYNATVTGSGTSTPSLATPARSGQQYKLTLS
jgi:hypothetical protein